MNFSFLKMGILLLFSFCLYSCFNDKKNKQQIVHNYDKNPNNDIVSEYAIREKIVHNYLKDNNLIFLDDTARWYLYNIYCDCKLPKSIDSNAGTQYLSFLPLIPLQYYIVHLDTLELYYSFIYTGLRVDDFPVDNNSCPIVNGVRISLKTNKVINFIKGRGTLSIDSEASEFNQLGKMKNKSFVIEHIDELNSWYRKELIRHNFIN